jgi:hypothetical protein
MSESGPLLPVPDERTLEALSNSGLLAALDVVLLELEKRVLHYARVGAQLQDMADEGLVLAVRTRARLGQALSSAQHAEGHLQAVGVGKWNPKGIRPAWNADSRLAPEEEGQEGTT